MKAKTKTKTTAVIATIVLGLYAPLEGNVEKVNAQVLAVAQPQTETADTPNATQNTAPTEAQQNEPMTESSGDDWLSNALGFLGDVGGFVEDELFGILSGFLGAIGLPDLVQLGSSIIKTPTSNNETTKVSEVLENNTGMNGSLGSYGIRDDRVMQAQRTGAMQTAESTSLSKKAQQRSALALKGTKQDTNDNMTLGIQSQNTDVTQDIMRNISLQTSLNSRVTQRLLQINQQAKDNAAITSAMTAQVAKEVSGKNTAERRQDISTRNQASQQGGMMMMPGVVSLENNTPSNDTWFSSPSESSTNSP